MITRREGRAGWAPETLGERGGAGTRGGGSLGVGLYAEKAPTAGFPASHVDASMGGVEGRGQPREPSRGIGPQELQSAPRLSTSTWGGGQDRSDAPDSAPRVPTLNPLLKVGEDRSMESTRGKRLLREVGSRRGMVDERPIHGSVRDRSTNDGGLSQEGPSPCVLCVG